jgi:threonine dehydratase
MRHLFEHAGLVVEPSAALGVAAVLEDPERFGGRTVATVICGSNIAPTDFRHWALGVDPSSTTATTDLGAADL